MIARQTRILLLAAASIGLAACGGDADDMQDAMEDAAANVAETAEAIENEVVNASKSFMETAKKDFDIIANEIAEREAAMGDALAGYWDSVQAEAGELSDAIEDDWKRLESATGEEAEKIEQAIAEKEREVERVLHEAKLAAIESEQEFEDAVAKDLDAMETEFTKLEAGAEELGDDALAEIKSDYDAAKSALEELGDASANEYEKDRIALSKDLAKLNSKMQQMVDDIG